MTSKAEFTPGPWVQFHDHGKPHSIMPAMRPFNICTFAEPMPTLADAQLLTTAPRLFHALAALEAWVTNDSDQNTKASRLAGRKALIEARAALGLAVFPNLPNQSNGA